MISLNEYFDAIILLNIFKLSFYAGVEGIGDVNALKLITKFGMLVFLHLGNIVICMIKMQSWQCDVVMQYVAVALIYSFKTTLIVSSI